MHDFTGVYVSLEKYDNVVVLEGSKPISFLKIDKVTKNTYTLSDGTKWNKNYFPLEDSPDGILRRIAPHLPEHDDYKNTHVVLTCKNRINREVRIRRVCASHINVDYGENSNFTVKIDLFTLKPINVLGHWDDFRLSQEDADKLLNSKKESE